MFPWNIAKSAEDMFSRWAIKRFCKFLLKKKLGQFILGDIDLEQLEVQLGAGTIQLNDLAFNVDFLNEKLSGSPIIIKEGSIGSLLAKVPWKGKGCQIEVDELELVLAPPVEDNFPAGDETNLSSQDCKRSGNHGFESLEHEMVKDASSSVSLDVREGVKTIAKMVKWFLTSFNIKIKKLIVAFDPCSSSKMNARSQTTLVLRVIETECGTCVSEDAAVSSDIEVESFLGMSRLTNFIKFKGAVIELLHMDDVDNPTQLPCAPGSCPSNVTTPILTGESGGFAGTLKVSIPWKNGSLDIRKVDADVFIEPMELRFQPSTIRWIISLWESLNFSGPDGRSHMNYKAKDLTFTPPFRSHSSTSLVSAAVATDKLIPNSENFLGDFCYATSQETAADALLPGSKVIPDWVPLSTNKDRGEKSGAEIDYGASIDQFFECFDGMRNSQSVLGNSGIWNLTCSVFSAITAASSLASGSLDIPNEQKHVETNFQGTFAGISVILSFHDEEQKHACDCKSLHYLRAKCGDVVLVLQNSPQEMKFKATVKHIELDDYFNKGNEAVGSSSTENDAGKQILFIQHLQEEVQHALPSFSLPANDPAMERAACNRSGINSGTTRDELVKVKLLKTSSVNHCQVTVHSTYSNDGSKGSIDFSVELPPFISWVNFNLLNMLFDFVDQVGSSSETNDANKCFGTKDFSQRQHDFSCHGGMKEGTIPSVTGEKQKGNLRGSILFPNARVFLCFPFKRNGDFEAYTAWDQYIAIDFCPPLSKGKMQNRDSQKGYSSGASGSVHLNFGNIFLYLINSCKDANGSNSFIQKHAFFAQKVFSVTSRRGCYPGVTMFWREGRVTGPWIAKKAQALATAQYSMSRNKVRGYGSEFASVSTLKDLENTHSHTRQEMILSSAFFLHVHLTSVSIHLNTSQYKDLHCLLNQVLDGLSSVASDKSAAPYHNSRKEASASQVSILAECDSLEILIDVDGVEDIKSSLQKELPGSWYSMKLKVQRFELLSVSDIGGISGAKFVWMGHGEGKLYGSITGAPSQELLLISCSNSMIGRGDGEGTNALSSGSAGTTIVHLWDPQSFQCITSVTIRCSTIVAPGGRLDWLSSISYFFSLPSDETDQKLMESFEGDSSYQAAFAFNLVDVALSYEPHIKNVISEGLGELYVACLLTAASLSISNQAVSNSIENDYKIRVQDLGLLLCALSGSENAKSTYSAESLRRMGYVKVAGEAFLEATLKTNCKNGLLWEVECSESCINLDTCHDTTSGLLRLVAQLQQLFAPDVEESIVHLQTRWNNVQQAHDRDDVISETIISNGGSAASPPQNYALSLDSNSGSSVVGLMDEICEDAFNLNEIRMSTCDTCGSQFCISLDGDLLGDGCNLDNCHARAFSHNSSFNESMSGLGVESTHASSPQGESFPEFIEGYYLSELCAKSELSGSNQSLPQNLKCKSSNTGRDGGSGSGSSGWYQDASLRIVENHISDISDHPGEYEFLRGDFPSTSSDGLCKASGRVLLKKIDVRWRMYGGTDWHDSGRSVQLTTNSSGRDTTVCLEFVLSKMDLRYDMFPDGEISVSKLSLSAQDIHLYDSSEHAPWKLVLGYYHSKDHPRESSAKAFKLDMEAVRPDPLTPLEECRLSIAFLPMLVHLHQDQLDFLINFFGEKGSSLDQSPNMAQDFDGSQMSPDKTSNFGGHTIAEEALLPYFQKFDIWPVLVRVDYSPCRFDLAALRSGRYVELVNLVPWKGVELHLKHVHAVGVYGWNKVGETIVGEWLEDISQNQIHKFLKGLPTVRSLLAVGSGASKLVSLPVKNYKKDHRLLKGVQRGAIAFLRSISLEAVGLGVHLAAGAHDILLQTEYILTSTPPSAPGSMRSRTNSNIRSNQPKDAQQGIQQAYESLSDGLEKTASALVGTPLKTYHRGAGAGSALASAVCAAPVAAIAPASAAARAVHYALLGVRNSLDPEHKKESMEKYLGPTQPREHS